MNNFKSCTNCIRKFYFVFSIPPPRKSQESVKTHSKQPYHKSVKDRTISGGFGFYFLYEFRRLCNYFFKFLYKFFKKYDILKLTALPKIAQLCKEYL